MKVGIGSLNEKQIDIFLCSIECLDVDQNKHEFLELLNADELRRYHRFVFDKDKNVFLGSRYLLRTLLSEYHPEVSPVDWDFDFNENGKPSIARGLVSEPVSFNLSHSKNNVALAFSKERGLGLDIESYLRGSDLKALAKYSFSEKEFSQMEGFDDDGFRDRFFSLWTLKEAYMKADGRGMSLPLKSFSFIFEDEGRCLAEFESEHIDSFERWHFWQFDTELDAFLALAIRSERVTRESFQIRTRKVTGLMQYQELDLPESI